MSPTVLHVLPHRGGGAETYVSMLERLPEFKHERFYLSSGKAAASAATSIPSRWPRLAAQVRRADLVHTHGDAATLISLPLLTAPPSVITTHGLNLLRRVTGIRQAVVGRAFALAAAASHSLICTSPGERAELEGLLRAVDRDKLVVIPNGIDPAARIAEAERTTTRRELGLDASTVLGLFVGDLDPNKAPLLAASAAVTARAAGLPFLLALAGDGPLARQLGLLAGPAVRLLGHRSDVPRLLGAADVFVHPSEREGMSFALLEAMAQSLPIVAADSPGAHDVIGDAGLLFDTGSESALVARLAKLISDPSLRASLGAKARLRVAQQFSATTFLSATHDVYRHALVRSRSDRRPQVPPATSQRRPTSSS